MGRETVRLERRRVMVEESRVTKKQTNNQSNNQTNKRRKKGESIKRNDVKKIRAAKLDLSSSSLLLFRGSIDYQYRYQYGVLRIIACSVTEKYVTWNFRTCARVHSAERQNEPGGKYSMKRTRRYETKIPVGDYLYLYQVWTISAHLISKW
jgi:hypothetical protein